MKQHPQETPKTLKELHNKTKFENKTQNILKRGEQV
jgi:hypothetical protein